MKARKKENSPIPAETSTSQNKNIYFHTIVNEIPNIQQFTTLRSYNDAAQKVRLP
jgi:hypothetical protein